MLFTFVCTFNHVISIVGLSSLAKIEPRWLRTQMNINSTTHIKDLFILGQVFCFGLFCVVCFFPTLIAGPPPCNNLCRVQCIAYCLCQAYTWLDAFGLARMHSVLPGCIRRPLQKKNLFRWSQSGSTEKVLRSARLPPEQQNS